MDSRALVAVVDDDCSVRESLPDLLRVLGFAARVFSSAEELLACGAIADVRCLILDMGLPGLSGPELQSELIRRGYVIPTLFITGRRDRSLRPVDCLFKPFSDADLQLALEMAFRRSRASA